MLVGRLIAIANRHLELGRRRGLRAVRVTPRQYALLKTLLEEGPLCHGEVARRLDMDPAAVTRMVHQMVKRGWIRRVRHERDLRALVLELEPAGRDLCVRGQEVYQEIGRRALEGLPESDREVLRRLLVRLIEHLPRDWTEGTDR